jgi:tripartite ATP-independent transporter DctM subunit
MLLALFLSFFLLLSIGVPIAFAMAASAIGVLWAGTNVPLIIAVQRIYAGADSFSLLAIPFFIIAGEVMTVSRMTDAIVALCQSVLGRLRSGLAGVTVAACVIFSGISGSGSADTAAVGSVMIPQLVARGYPRGLAAAIVAVSGALGPIIPPSILMVIYAAIAEVSIGKMFLAGIVPGLLIGTGLFGLLYVLNRFHGWEVPDSGRFNLREFSESLKASAIPLGTPLVIIGGIVGGVFTVTEASVIAAVYALAAAALYRRMSWQELRDVFLRSGLLSSLSLFVIAMSAIFSWILAREGLPQLVVAIITDWSGGQPLVGVLLVVIALLILGIYIEVLPLIVIFTPVLSELGNSLGYDPIHWGLLMIMTMNIGGVTPPVGSNLFIAASIARCNLSELSYWAWILTGVHVAGVILVIMWPALALWMPEVLMP